jgi:hypothetical protein
MRLKRAGIKPHQSFHRDMLLSLYIKTKISYHNNMGIGCPNFTIHYGKLDLGRCGRDRVDDRYETELVAGGPLQRRGMRALQEAAANPGRERRQIKARSVRCRGAIEPVAALQEGEDRETGSNLPLTRPPLLRRKGTLLLTKYIRSDFLNIKFTVVKNDEPEKTVSATAHGRGYLIRAV